MEIDNKPILSVDTEGNVLKCAKSLDAGSCGYKGGPVCAKCGAKPVAMKMVPLDEDVEFKGMVPESQDEMDESEEEPMSPEDDMEEETEDSMDEEKTGYYEKYGYSKYKEKYGKKPYMPSISAEEVKGMLREVPKDLDLEAEDDEMPEDDEMLEEEDDEMESSSSKKGMAESEMDTLLADMRDIRIKSLGLDIDELGDNGYVCAIERKSHPGGHSVCDDCPGGCVAEKGLPGLLHVEGLAEHEFKGIVIDSGYSAEADMFVVDVQVKDGSVREVFIDGTTAEIVGYHKLDDDIFEKKSAVDEMMVIGFVEAAEIAVKSIDGTVIAVEPDVFEGIDSYAVEIDGIDGKSYDVFVGLDGEVLGYDKYEPEEAEDIEAEAAEIALKRAFSEERRMGMAKEGMAMPDGSYPIASEDDLKNAIQAYGRAKDKEATKRHIMKRAREMGKESLIPSNWVAGGDTSKKEDQSIDGEFMKSLIEFELLQSDDEFS